MNIYEKLAEIQSRLKAPKNQRNDFGKYNYRNAEDILEAVKPLCKELNCVILLTDEVVQQGERYYVKATAKLQDTDAPNTSILTAALAREEESKKGMDASQVTGASSSYARKYALNGLFAIDDTKDADFNNNGKEKEKPFENIPDSKNYTLEECFNTEIRTRDGIKKLKDCTDEQLKILIAGSIQKIKDKANTILLFREGQK